MNAFRTCLLVLMCSMNVQSQGELQYSHQLCLDVPLDIEHCYRQFHGKPITNQAAQVYCLQNMLWNYTPDRNLTSADRDLFRQILGYADNVISLPNAQTRAGTESILLTPPTGQRTRKEYRLLTDVERKRFNVALQRLYEDGSIRSFARLHNMAFGQHGGGGSFLPKLRIFLLIFEEVLRRHDSSISLPYWDSTIDNDMENPVHSILWTPEYFGNGVGPVTSGFAAGWVTDQGLLERNYGRSSRLMAKDEIKRLFSRCKLQDISPPTAAKDYDLWHIQKAPFVWVGGDMAYPSTASYDPISYLHYAFVDYVWELFRRHQHNDCDVDPSRDYPEVLLAVDTNAPNASMIGIEWLRNIDGAKMHWIDHWYSYESTLSCPDCCPGCRFPSPMYCDRAKGVCVTRSRRKFAPARKDSLNGTTVRDIETFDDELSLIKFPPRNRGMVYDAPENNRRNVHTADVVKPGISISKITSNDKSKESINTFTRNKAEVRTNRTNDSGRKGSQETRILPAAISPNRNSHQTFSVSHFRPDSDVRSDPRRHIPDSRFVLNRLPPDNAQLHNRDRTTRRIISDVIPAETRTSSVRSLSADAPLLNRRRPPENRVAKNIQQLETPQFAQTGIRRDIPNLRSVPEPRFIQEGRGGTEQAGSQVLLEQRIDSSRQPGSRRLSRLPTV